MGNTEDKTTLLDDFERSAGLKTAAQKSKLLRALKKAVEENNPKNIGELMNEQKYQEVIARSFVDFASEDELVKDTLDVLLAICRLAALNRLVVDKNMKFTINFLQEHMGCLAITNGQLSKDPETAFQAIRILCLLTSRNETLPLLDKSASVV